jgi:putative endonuclease
VIPAPAVGMTDDVRHVLGKMGENLACIELRRLGYSILATRHRTRFGEIDIVARHEGFTVFIEVKTRTADDFGGGLEAVTPRKQRRIAQMAIDYVARLDQHDTPCRFDVVTVDVGDGEPRVEVYPHAFDSAY